MILHGFANLDRLRNMRLVVMIAELWIEFEVICKKFYKIFLINEHLWVSTGSAGYLNFSYLFVLSLFKYPAFQMILYGRIFCRITK